MANIVIVSVVAVKSSAMFMLVNAGEKLHIVKSWGRASYPVPCALVLDKDVNALDTFKACGLPCFEFKSSLEYANNCFSDDKEMSRIMAMVAGKPATVAASKPATVAASKPATGATQAPIVSIEHDAQGVPSTLADALSDLDKKAVNFRDFRKVCLAEGMPEKLTSPNAVRHWASSQIAAEPTATATVQPTSEAVQPTQAQDDLMAQFLAFQRFMQAQAK